MAEGTMARLRAGARSTTSLIHGDSEGGHPVLCGQAAQSARGAVSRSDGFYGRLSGGARAVPAALHLIRDTADHAISALRRLGRSSEQILDDMLVYLVVHKLDAFTKRAWKLKSSNNDTPPSYSDLTTFLANRALALDDDSAPNSTKSRREVGASANATTSQSFEPKCTLCQQAHYFNKCSLFLRKSVAQRREYVKEANRCFNCLSTKHLVSDCASKFACRTCQGRHHSLLHTDSPESSTANTANITQEDSAQGSSSSEDDEAVALSTLSSHASPSPVLLATATIIVSADAGRSQTVRALLDQGSEVTFITESLAQAFRLRRVRTATIISAVGGLTAWVCKSAANITIISRHQTEHQFRALAFILKSVIKYAPRRTVPVSEWRHLHDLKLADEHPTGSAPIGIILGAEVYSRILLDGVRTGSCGEPTAQNTHLGWILSGPITASRSPATRIAVNHCLLEQEIRRFWEIEEIARTKILTPDEQRCEEHFRLTHSRAPDGKYIVRLPFKTRPPIDIGASRNLAERLLNSLNRRLARNDVLKQDYVKFISEYESLGHMTRVQPPRSSEGHFTYIPHHPVIRASSLTTKLSVVFNASSATDNGSSLNSHLYAEPKLQTDLVGVLLRWRQPQYVYIADIAKMYRQIWIDARDRDCQRILWFDEAFFTAQDYQLNTVTYGMVTAPYLALRVLQQLVHDEGHNFPLAVSILTENIYVDDVLFGADDILLLQRIRQQVCDLLNRAGFVLRKWASNQSELLTDIPSEDHGLACTRLLQSAESLNVLGISWQPASDSFQFSVELPTSVPFSKRSILSTIAKIFDPLGWITPVTVSAKIFMQTLWRTKLDWDDPLPQSLMTQWERMYRNLPDLNGLKLPRWTGFGADTKACELHGFADASTSAYAAVVYLRIISLSGKVAVSLLMGKSKVAPLKPITVPRLELSAAALLTRLMAFIKTTLDLKHVDCYCWTDSTVTLAWIAQHPSRWKTFVAHRVTDIRTRLPCASWRHVSTHQNPADCGSRGLLNSELISASTWWTGPPWLYLPQSEWPTLGDFSSSDIVEEARPSNTLVTHTQPSWSLAERYSSWLKLTQVTAYVMRVLNNCRHQRQDDDNRPNAIALTAKECQAAQMFWLRTVQSELFPDELKALHNHQALTTRNRTIQLNPFLDSQNIIRVGGRLKHAPFSFATKHPILLAPHPIVKLIISHVHVANLHSGIQLTLSSLRQTYWVLQARTLTKQLIHQCITCTREKAKIPTQLMGQLPQARVSTPGRAFAHCGVDYAGPVFTRASSGRGITSRKGYIAIFICLASRAAHLELVSDYTSLAFLRAYSRFCARRGLPTPMYSDNGSTFTGAEKELALAYQQALRDPTFLNKSASDQVSWKFIPPHAPYFGGLWEADVRSMKHHLRRVLGSHMLTFEEFSTLLCKIEACLNSRSIGALTDVIDDYEPLTPGHFLIGSAINLSPEPSVLTIKENRLSRWQLVRQITEKFWRIWQNDYVNTLQQRFNEASSRTRQNRLHGACQKSAATSL